MWAVLCASAAPCASSSVSLCSSLCIVLSGSASSPYCSVVSIFLATLGSSDFCFSLGKWAPMASCGTSYSIGSFPDSFCWDLTVRCACSLVARCTPSSAVLRASRCICLPASNAFLSVECEVSRSDSTGSSYCSVFSIFLATLGPEFGSGLGSFSWDLATACFFDNMAFTSGLLPVNVDEKSSATSTSCGGWFVALLRICDSIRPVADPFTEIKSKPTRATI